MGKGWEGRENSWGQTFRDIQKPVTEVHFLKGGLEEGKWFTPGQELSLEEESVPDNISW